MKILFDNSLSPIWLAKKLSDLAILKLSKSEVEKMSRLFNLVLTY